MQNLFKLKKVVVVNGKQPGSKSIITQQHIQRYGWFRKNYRNIQVGLQNNKRYVIVIEKGKIEYYHPTIEFLDFIKTQKGKFDIECQIEEDDTIDIQYLIDTYFTDKDQLSLSV